MPKQNLKYHLKNILNETELQLMPTSFDAIGGIMIFADFPEELIKKEKKIGNEILKHYKNIKTILRKTKKFSGKYRLPKYKIIAGEKTKETTYKENSVFLKLNVEEVYFSPRLSSERLRIAKLVKNNEEVLVMFSGSAVYPLVIAKNAKPKIVYGIEINPIAHKYALENVKLNKLENKIRLIKGDVKNITKKIFSWHASERAKRVHSLTNHGKIFLKKFNRIIMPLPKNAEHYLGIALKFIKKNGIINFYFFSDESEIENVKKIIEKECKKQNKKCEIMNMIKCGQYGPNIFRVCIDFKIS